MYQLDRLSHTNSKRCLSCLFLLVWSKETIFSYIVALVARIPIIGEFSGFLYGFLVIALLIFAFRSIRIYPQNLILLIMLIFSYLLSYFLKPENEIYLTENIDNVFISAVPMFFLMQSLDMENMIWKKSVKEWLYYLSILITITSSMYMFYLLNIRGIVNYDNGNMAYIVLMSALVVLTKAFLNPDVISIVVSGFGFIMILSYGARGPCLCFLAYIFLHICFNTKKRILWIILCAVAIIIAYRIGWIDMLLDSLQNFVAKMGLSTRVFDFLYYDSGQWESDADRMRIYGIIRSAIEERPLLGHGILGDRAIIGGWSHNFIYELWIDFGIVIGTLVLIGFAIHIIRGLLATKRNSYARGMILLLISGTVVMFFFSGSLWVSKYFFMLLGFCSLSIRDKRKGL